ncbi:MAG TPA: DNA repair protein RadC [Candidatus Bathyarchaeia archaeon]|nr:DNA repair protein RadC [Candidatus Bathyarchaeia archaeon]
MTQPIKHWSQDDRPREKLWKNGEHTLSNAELLAILLRTGTKGKSAVDLAREMMFRFRSFQEMSHLDPGRWKEIKGLGAAKIAQIRAALEIGRRFREDAVKEERPQIRSSKEIVEMMQPRLRDLKKEVFKVVFLDSQNRIIEVYEAAQGTVNQATPIIREILHKALQYYAVSLICVHNHPSGNPAPSPQDRAFTQKLAEAGKIMQVNVLDHIIIGAEGYYSFGDEGALNAI